MATEPAQIRHLVDRAMRIALAERTVTCLILPNDLQEADAVEAPPHEHGTIHTGAGFGAPATSSRDASSSRRAAEILNAGEKVAILVGAGALGAPRRGHRGRRPLGAGVAKALLGKAACPTTCPTSPARSACSARSRAGT